jgi:hypothetical protein
MDSIPSSPTTGIYIYKSKRIFIQHKAKKESGSQGSYFLLKLHKSITFQNYRLNNYSSAGCLLKEISQVKQDNK